MAFDLSTAVPVKEGKNDQVIPAQGFDLSTAQPVSAVEEPLRVGVINYLKNKYQKGYIPMVRGTWGRDAMLGRTDTQEALKRANKDTLIRLEETGKIEDYTFKEAPVRFLLGEAAELLPFMLGATEAGAKTALTLGGAFAGITALAGQAGPQALLPEEVVTVPTAFATGITTGFQLGVIKYSQDIEGGNLYLDLIENGITEETARPLAIVGGTAIGIIEVAQLKLLTLGARKLFVNALTSKVGKNAVLKVLTNYLKVAGGEILEEELQEMTQLTTELIAAQIEQKPDAVPTREEWLERLKQVALKAGPGMAVLALPGATIEAGSYAWDAKRVVKESMQSEKATLTEPRVAKQATIERDAKKFYTLAKEPQAAIAKDLEDIAKELKFTARQRHIQKAAESMVDKVLRKGEDYTVDKMWDHARGAVIMNDASQQAAVEKILVSKGWKKTSDYGTTMWGGYISSHYKKTFPNKVHGEIQEHTPATWAYKEKVSDIIYREVRDTIMPKIKAGIATPSEFKYYRALGKISETGWKATYAGKGLTDVIKLTSWGDKTIASLKSSHGILGLPVASTQAPSSRAKGGLPSSIGRSSTTTPLGKRIKSDISIPSTKKIPQKAAVVKGLSEEAKIATKDYEVQKDIWFGQKDVRVHKTQTEKARLQKEIKVALGKKKYDVEAQDYDKAIQLYIDTKRNPQDLIDFYDNLTSEQKRLVDLSQNLPPKIQVIADKISESYRQIGLEAQEADIIKNVLDNYVNRTWDLTPKQSTTLFRKFGTTTPHAKRRVFGTILEGWAKDYRLKVEGATNNLQILKEEMVKTIEDKNFLKALQQLKTIDGESLLTTKQMEGYKQIEHPNFKVWRYAGEAEPGKVYGKNVFVTDENTLMERKELYAPEAQAKNLNNILGVSKLKGIKWIDALTKFNASTKALILQSSFFHHLAFMRSYYFGTNKKLWSEMSVRQAYRQGLEAIERESPIIELGVKNGLTLGLKQDWNEELLREKGAISNFLDKNKVTGVIKDKIMELRQGQADFLFGKFGAGLKAKSFIIEYRNLSKKHPELTADENAKMAANLINDDFGGLHLQRMGRNPTVQHMFRLAALAPDWTESNVRTMVKAFKAGGKEEAIFYRRFWAGILTKAVGLTVMANLLMAQFDEDDREARGAWQRFIRNYKNAWQAGKFKWLSVDITPLYKALGGKGENRKYFSILGHFQDPLKFIVHPIRSAHHKGSVVYRFFHEALVGADWAGRKFTTVQEITGIDPTDKKKKKKGKTVAWSFGGGGPLKYEQIPSFMVSQIKGWMPIQIQNLINWIAGEMEGFDAIAKSAGLRVSTTYGKKKKKARF